MMRRDEPSTPHHVPRTGRARTWGVTIAVVMTSTIVMTGCSGGSAVPSSSSTTVIAARAGWRPVVDGAAEILVPADWSTISVDCPYGPAPGTVIVRSAAAFTTCPLETGAAIAEVVRVAPLSPPVLIPTARRTSIDGIEVVWGRPEEFYERGYQVPSLGVQIDAQGPVAREVLDTLARAKHHA